MLDKIRNFNYNNFISSVGKPKVFKVNRKIKMQIIILIIELIKKILPIYNVGSFLLYTLLKISNENVSEMGRKGGE